MILDPGSCFKTFGVLGPSRSPDLWINFFFQDTIFSSQDRVSLYVTLEAVMELAQ